MPRQQKIHSAEIFEKARKLVKNEGYSLHKAANELEVPYSTLKDHLNGRYKGYSTQFGQSPLLDPQDELTVVNYATFMASRGVPLTRPVLKRIALEIILQRGGDSRVNVATGPSDKWVRRFLQRHQSLSVRTAHPLEQDRVTLSQRTVSDYFDLLEATLNDLGIRDEPSRIFNCDESGFSGKLNPSKKVIVPKGTRHACQSMVNLSGHFTLLNAISAAGQTIPPMLIFSQCLPRMVSDGMPENWAFVTDEKGYINTDLFVQWFEHNFVPYIGEKRPVLLILDNHSTHVSKTFIDAACRHKVDLLYLPAHSSHLLQPQDSGYFHIIKQKVADISTELGYLGIKTLPRHLFPKILMQAFNKTAGSTVVSAFKCTGIYPLNKEAVKALLPDTKPKQSEHATISSHANNEQSVCEHCGHSKENTLVKLGIISEDLSSILVEPPLPKQQKTGSKRKSYASARSIVTSKPVKTKKILKDGIKIDRYTLKNDKQQTTETEVLRTELDNRDVCIVCMVGDRPEYTWVGCDRCDKWYHYECLPSNVQTDIDLSLVTSTEWMCRYCEEEE